MTVFDFAIGVGAFCGLIMVAGSIYLLRAGVINLKAIPETGQTPALEAAIREIRISTRYPALGLFIIGLIFVLGSAWLGKPPADVTTIPTVLTLDTAPGTRMPNQISAEIQIRSNPFPIFLNKDTPYIYHHYIHPTNLLGVIYIPGYPPIKRLFQFKNNIFKLDIKPDDIPKPNALPPPLTGRTIASG